ncbi:PREDICTED: serine/threonine/tyrosine-interacting-like protein 1 [Priapulus caudatus]|uniref:Serine/threonine/tyrosine-interacting-like protein 1 n=1 Tax=Priapulus caudatus TaxID=37621 RepID=A0ABM1DZQ2_PRICU|nr:PREDICTED: serine/threonine/tyrosine-interacting-like protein 1 [Priapulus caudatus]
MKLQSEVTLVELTDLFNYINQEGRFVYLSNPNYLLLLDARDKIAYAEDHIITARNVLQTDSVEFVPPCDTQLECQMCVVVYDGNTSDLNSDGAAVKCARMITENGSRNPVKILKGGYEQFSARYPFLRTKKMIYMPRELDALNTYPLEVVPGRLYLGKRRAHRVPDATLIACSSTSAGKIMLKDDTGAVLVYSNLGICRSVAMILAYLMYKQQCTLNLAWTHVKRCCVSMKPNRGFVNELTRWERHLGIEPKTDVTADVN